MPDRVVEARRHTPEQRDVLRELRRVTKRIDGHRADFEHRNALYVRGRQVGLVFLEMAEVAGTSEVAVIQAVKKVTTATGESAEPPERVRRKSATK
jgi:hypothetical protein